MSWRTSCATDAGWRWEEAAMPSARSCLAPGRFSSPRWSSAPTWRPTSTTTALIQSRQWGRIEVFPSAVAAIAGHAATRCYGISGMAARGLRDGFAELLRRENVDKGVDVVQADDALVIDVYVIVQYGIRISEVAHNLQETVKFEVERSVNVPVVKVNVNVQGVREERI